LFSLCPYHKNERAERLITYLNNGYNVLILSHSTLALDVGFYLRGKSSKTLVILGRGINTNIYVEGSSILRVQYLFEIDLDTSVIMLYDRLFANSTQVFSENATLFEREYD
jgi:hypothetical protein